MINIINENNTRVLSDGAQELLVDFEELLRLTEHFNRDISTYDYGVINPDFISGLEKFTNNLRSLRPDVRKLFTETSIWS